MARHVSFKLCTLGTIIALLITAFSKPDPIDLTIHTHVQVLAEPRDLGSVDLVQGPAVNITYRVKATGYNSEVSQTDSTPHITATGATTRFGIIAASRDLLDQELPYGSLVRITDLGNYHNGQGQGAFQEVLDAQEMFVVEDTMHRRKQEQIDVWFETRREAEIWGVRHVEIEVIRYGREGPDMTQWQRKPVSLDVADAATVFWD